MSLTTAKATFQTALAAAFTNNAAGRTPVAAAQEITDALDSWLIAAIATVTVPAGTFLVAATAGVPNPAPVPLVGDPGAGTGGLT